MEVERALSVRSAFSGKGPVVEFYGKELSYLKFEWEGEMVNLEVLLSKMSVSRDAEFRRKALKVNSADETSPPASPSRLVPLPPPPSCHPSPPPRDGGAIVGRSLFYDPGPSRRRGPSVAGSDRHNITTSTVAHQLVIHRQE